MRRGVAGLVGTALVMIVLSSAFSGFQCSAELLAEGWLPNGSQTMLADPIRPMMYRANFSADSLEFLDSDTGSVIESIPVGLGPSSIAISGDGALLYVALSAELNISVVDIESGSVLRDIYLGFAPFSVTVGRPDRLYVSSVQDSDWRVVDESDGTILRVMTGTYCPILEASPDGDTLIAADCGLSPVKIKKYRISTDNPSLLAEDDHDLGSYLQQYAVDWSGGVIYTVSGAPYGIETISLSDLSRTGFMPCDGYTRGVALSPDREIVYAMHNTFYDSAIWVYTTTGTLLNNLPLSGGECLYLELAGDEKGLFVVDPLQRFEVAPSFEPGIPNDGAILGYTPSTIEATFIQGLLPIDGDVTMSLDGDALEFEYPSAELLQATISSLLTEGTHTVNVSAQWYTETIWTEWTFTIDPDDPLALRPVLTPSSPTPDATLSWPPDHVSASITLPDPPPVLTSAMVRINDTLEIDPILSSVTIWAYLDMMLDPGTYTVQVSLWYDFGTRVATVSWSFTISKYQLVAPQMTPVSPSPYSTIYQSPEYIEFDLDFGEPEIEVLWLNVSLDGSSPLEVEAVDDDTFRAVVTQELLDGEHLVTVTLVWDADTAWLDWIFYLILPWDLEDFRHDSGFSIPVPVGWNRFIDLEDEDGVTELEAHGPIVNGMTTTLVVDTEKDSTLTESEEYMEEQIDLTVEGLQSEGINVRVQWVAYRDVGGQFGVVFALDMWQLHASVLAAIAISDDDDRFWMIMIVVSSALYEKANLTFAQIVDGFETTSGLPLSTTTMIIAAAVVAAAVVVPLIIYAYVARRKRSTIPAGAAGVDAKQVVTSAESGYCGICGARQPLSSTMCASCGTRLPSPPFGTVPGTSGDQERT